jgi:hypothetical protein
LPVLQPSEGKAMKTSFARSDSERRRVTDLSRVRALLVVGLVALIVIHICAWWFMRSMAG